jgi:hypothetical protein
LIDSIDGRLTSATLDKSGYEHAGDVSTVETICFCLKSLLDFCDIRLDLGRRDCIKLTEQIGELLRRSH